MEFRPLNLATLYQSADAGVAQAMQMNLMAFQTARMRDEYDREDALRNLAKEHFTPDPATGEVKGDLRTFSRAAMQVDPMKAPQYEQMAAAAEKSALERAKLQGDIDEQRRKGAMERLKLMGEASSAPYLKYKELVDSGVEDVEARKQVQPLYVQGVRNLVASGMFTQEQMGKFDLRPEFDPAVAEVGHRQVIGANGALDEFFKRKQADAPKSDLGKLKADFDAKKIDKPTYDAAVAKAVENSDWTYDAERAILVNKKTGGTKAVGAPDGGGALPPKPADVEGLRKEFNNREEVKNYNAAVPVLRAIAKAPDTAAGDLDLIYGVGKILDPGSVVREGEMALVIKSGSMMERLVGAGRFEVGKGRITPAQREKFMEALQGRVNELHTAATDARKPFEAQAKRQNIPLDETLTLPELPKVAKKSKAEPGSAIKAGHVEDGFRFKGGDPSKPENWEKAS